MTAAFIEFHATERPDAVALIENGRTITYAEFSRDIRKFTEALREFDLPRQGRVAIICDNVYVHWLLRLACEELGLISASVRATGDLNFLALLDDFDLTLLDRTLDSARTGRQIVITPQWLDGIVGRADWAHPAAVGKQPDDPLRILHTSGTTGTPKRLLYPRRVHEHSVTKSMWFNGVARQSRYLLTIPFTVGASYANATACIRSGAMVVVEDRTSLADAILRYGITHLALAPIHLKRMLDELPSPFAKPPKLTIFSFGAAVSGALCERALAEVATEVCDMYGSNEAGYVSSMRWRSAPQSLISCVWPGVQVQIVDDRDRPLPFGQPGQIRVKTDCMVQGYLNDDEASQRMFRDGWFYAGDVGILTDPHRLRVLGRGDELLNIGWNKFSPSVLEGLVMKVADVADVGVCSIPNAEGIEEIYVVVAGSRTSSESLVARLNRTFSEYQVGTFYVLEATRIPRNANGKIQRDVLRQAVAVAAERKPPSYFIRPISVPER
jgi:acyl-coenzyme A synthetase/AMP-(fatty) acid ligase